MMATFNLPRSTVKSVVRVTDVDGVVRDIPAEIDVLEFRPYKGPTIKGSILLDSWELKAVDGSGSYRGAQGPVQQVARFETDGPDYRDPYGLADPRWDY